MKFEISPASIQEKIVLQNLMQLYLYDFSEIDGDDVDDSGRFTYGFLDLYWIEPERHPFLIRVDGKLAGFALVRQANPLAGEAPETGETCMHMAEFFILRKYRHQGIGARAAWELFDRLPGRWEVFEIIENTAAQEFWRKAIGEYTGGDYREYFLDNEQWHGPVQVFEAGRLELGCRA
jgi:predicted acetyltransferase